MNICQILSPAREVLVEDTESATVAGDAQRSTRRDEQANAYAIIYRAGGQPDHYARGRARCSARWAQ